MSNMQNRKGVIIIEGHVQGLANTRALGRKGIPVIVVDKSECVAAASKYCLSFYKCPDYQEDEFIDFLIELAQKKDLIDWILMPSNDHAVYNISKNLDKIKIYYKSMIPNINIIEKIYNKANLLNLAKSINVPIPETYYFENINQLDLINVNFPLLTKGKIGLSFYKSLRRKAFLSSTKQELESQLKLIEQKIPLNLTFTQELIPFNGKNKTVSLGAFCVEGEIKAYWMGIKLREHPLQFGTATFTESIYVEECLIYSKKLLKALSYTGVCEVEFLQDPRDNKYKLIEINARTWLWVGHAINNGINFPMYIYQYLNDERIIYPQSYTVGLKWRNPFSDLIYTFISVFKGKTSVLKVFQENRGKINSALWDVEDKKPFYRYARMMLHFLKNR